jgi:UDP-N-acetyl-D-glucosamine dehydrogenase
VSVENLSVSRGAAGRGVLHAGRGRCPGTDRRAEGARSIHRTVCEKRTFLATHREEALQLADVIIVDVQCDYRKRELGNVRSGTVDMEALEQTFRTIGRLARPETLVLIETTVAPGTTEQIAYPIIQRGFQKRGIASEPLLAHSYERVMPGRQYVASIRDFWRVCSGTSDAARERVKAFLGGVLNTKEYPLTVLDRPIESETAKIIENSYRATILAFMDEWSTFAERNGVDLKRVIEAIRIRPTHSNIMFPGPGIGGYCLPKDGGLGLWGYRHILGWEDDIFRMTPTAIDINDTRALHVPQLVRDALRNMGEPIAAAEILLLGVSYREDVGDTRYSGPELIVRRLAEMGASLRVHDPYVERWTEFQDTDEDSAGRGRFFERQGELVSLKMQPDLWEAMRGVKAIVLAVRHAPYLEMDPDRVVKSVGGPCAVIDCALVLDDAKIARYLELGCEVKGMGRGHIKRIKERLRRES